MLGRWWSAIRQWLGRLVGREDAARPEDPALHGENLGSNIPEGKSFGEEADTPLSLARDELDRAWAEAESIPEGSEQDRFITDTIGPLQDRLDELRGPVQDDVAVPDVVKELADQPELPPDTPGGQPPGDPVPPEQAPAPDMGGVEEPDRPELPFSPEDMPGEVVSSGSIGIDMPDDTALGAVNEPQNEPQGAGATRKPPNLATRQLAVLLRAREKANARRRRLGRPELPPLGGPSSSTPQPQGDSEPPDSEPQAVAPDMGPPMGPPIGPGDPHPLPDEPVVSSEEDPSRPEGPTGSSAEPPRPRPRHPALADDDGLERPAEAGSPGGGGNRELIEEIFNHNEWQEMKQKIDQLAEDAGGGSRWGA